MLDLSQRQRLQLYEFILDGRRQIGSIDAGLQRTLEYIMSSIDVRKTERIGDESSRELVRCAFLLMKNEYLLENGLITFSTYEQTISMAQEKARQHFPVAQTADCSGEYSLLM